MKCRMVAAAAAAFATLIAMPASAADPRYPDWPCVQVKVPEISVAAVWQGPPIDDVGDSWRSDPEVAGLVNRLAPRRTSLEEAGEAIAEFMAGSPEQKGQKAKLLFAGLLSRLNAERVEVIDGIERFTRRQREFARQVEEEVASLRDLHDAPEPDETRIAELSDRVNWQTRVFEERRKSIRYACEVPVLIDQRVFALSRLIQQHLD